MFLEDLTNAQVEELKSDPLQLNQCLTDFIPRVESAFKLNRLKRIHLDGLKLGPSLKNGVPGRKLDQIASMGGAALKYHSGSEWLEWCSGKGFLGRVLADHSGQPVTSFEYQRTLCDVGQKRGG